MIATTEMITALAPSRIFITHFGELTNIRETAALLIDGVREYVGVTEAAAGDKTKIKAGLAKPVSYAHLP